MITNPREAEPVAQFLQFDLVVSAHSRVPGLNAPDRPLNLVSVTQSLFFNPVGQFLQSRQKPFLGIRDHRLLFFSPPLTFAQDDSLRHTLDGLRIVHHADLDRFLSVSALNDTKVLRVLELGLIALPLPSTVIDQIAKPCARRGASVFRRRHARIDDHQGLVRTLAR